MHGTFSIPGRTLGLRPTDQSCHHETWLHLDFSSTGATLRTRKVNTVDTFPSKNALRHFVTGNRKDA